jgi:hypothetical protein
VLLISEAAGVSHETAEKRAATEREIVTLVKQEKDNAALEKELREKLAGQQRRKSTSWSRRLLRHGSATSWRTIPRRRCGR